MEVDALELAIRKATTEDFEKLEENLKVFEEYARAGDIAGMNDKDVEFHTLILEATRNPSFIRIGKTVMELFARPMARAIKDVGPEHVLTNHRAQLAALKAGNLELATRLVSNAFKVTQSYF